MTTLNSITAPVSDKHVFENPTKLIKTINDMKIWEKSEAYFEYIGFILAINDAVKGKSNTKGSEKCSEAVLKVVKMLDRVDTKIDETPPVQQPQRFGNIAFRTWYQKLRDDSLVLLQQILPPELFKAVTEVVSYLVDGFGNSTRIDYGTGHEISFVMFLCCLFRIGFLKDSDKMATGCKIFPRYLEICRKLQQTYRMEPAGSHGVWSLDDFQFVPFIWGSSQLFAHPVIEPSSFMNQNILTQYADDYMFLSCIRYINEVKTGPFAEHSNQLWSISGVPSWSKINGGLIKMYKAEVLSKFPVVQHIVFGSLFTLKAVEQSIGLMTAKTSMIAPPVPFPKESRGSSIPTTAQSSVTSIKKPDSGGVIQEERSGSDLSSLAGSEKKLSETSVGSQPSKTSADSSGKLSLENQSQEKSEKSEAQSLQKSEKSEGQSQVKSEKSEASHDFGANEGGSDAAMSYRISAENPEGSKEEMKDSN